MKKIVVDITALEQTKFLSGIQRVTIEYIKRLITNNYNVFIVYYDISVPCFYVVNKKRFLEKYKINRSNENIKSTDIFDLKNIDNTYIWIDTDSVWDCICLSRMSLYKYLKKMGTTIVSLVHDLLPIKFPHFSSAGLSRDYIVYLSAVIQHSDIILVSSLAIKDELKDLLSKMNLIKKIEIVPFGSDFASTAVNISNLKVSKKIKVAVDEKYLLCVATLEPRKNHKYILECFDKYLVNENINIIMAGRIDPFYKKIYKKILSHPLFNKRIFFFETPTNDEIAFLYKKAWAVIFASYGEGFGLPIIESMFYKCPVFASNIPVFKEVSQNLACLFHLNDTKNLYDTILPYLHSDLKYNKLKNKIKKFKILLWNDSFKYLSEVLEKA